MSPADIRNEVKQKLAGGQIAREELREYVRSLDQRMGDATLNKMLNAREVIGIVAVGADGTVSMSYKLGGE